MGVLDAVPEPCMLVDITCKKLLSEALLPVTPKVLSKFLKLWSRLVDPAAAMDAVVAAVVAVPVGEVCAIKALSSEAN